MTESADVRVRSLSCARAEDAMSEGMLEGFALEHVSQCQDCRELAELLELAGTGPGLVTATAPAALPSGFVDSVLDRAFDATHPLDRIRPATDDLRVAELEAALADRRSRTRWIAAGALAAGLLLAAGVSSILDRNNKPAEGAATLRVAKSESVAPVQPSLQVARTAPSADAGAATSDRVTASGATVPSVETRQPATAAAPTPAIAPPKKPEAVPEQMLDIPAEIRALLVQKIRAHQQCPKRNTVPVRVTLTVGTGGTVSSPQVLSNSGHAAAHQCVSYALDRLLLPPLKRAVTVTLDLTW